MRRISRIERRSLLTGWIKWALLPAIPFSVFFFDAWLNVQVRNKDYELSQLNAVRRELNLELDSVHSKEARISGVEHLSEMAGILQLASPGPQQFKTVSYQESSRQIPVMNLAQGTAPSARPTSIDLVEVQRIALAKKETSAPVVAVVAEAAAPTQVEPLLHEDIVQASGTMVSAEAVLIQPATMTQNNAYQDSELSVEDMLGRL